jgi:hypothetical protein
MSALGQFVLGPLATIPAIVFGHMARHQIRCTGEQGAGLALAGLILGWAAVILGILLIGAAIAAGMHGTMQMQRTPTPARSCPGSPTHPNQRQPTSSTARLPQQPRCATAGP